MTEESAVKVCVRVRPLIAREESTASENAEPVQLFWKTDKKSIHQIDDGNSTKTFSFDRVFTAEETTNQLYQDIAKPLVVSTVEGYNGTIFAYGQTSSGKTFTMMGSNHIPGVTPLAVEDVFQTIKNCPKKEFLLRVSYMEIYNETVTDLLVDSWKRKPLEVRETINKNIYVADLTEELVTSPAQALAWIRKGEKNRHYGKTKMNQRSSRSHTIFRMILESRERSDLASGENADGAIIVSHLNLVDLAGSERASQTGAEGTRFKEGCNINRSLFTLGQVIKKVTEESQKGFTNYRDSKLTRILQNSLGGNAKTVIICTITPVTLDETLSTLQFASTAKKMKNDPHVTEVSDDGALLKRYRNEIVDLKRRLHEVSSETQTTVTEKEVLSQLLQEKDHLQREQEDRIRNLTKLLVTSSNLVPVKRMPKRRVTWGGKMLRLAPSSACGGSSNLSFAEAFTLKRKADRSCLMELTEDDEEFDAHWEIPDEPSDDMEMSHSSVTVQSFGDSPKDYTSPDWMRNLSGKVSDLELQLEMESQQKEEAMTKVETLEGRVAELELQLQTEAQQKQEALEKVQITEKRAAELELQLQTEAQQKQEALEKVQITEKRAAELELQLQTEAQQKQEALEKVQITEKRAAELEQQQQSKALEAMEKELMLELRLADREKQLEEQNHGQTENEQIRKEFAETIQLCETLASEKDKMVAERDYLKEELGMFIEQTERLENEKAALSQELEEKRETDEFKSLEEEFKKEQELEVQNEISSYKKVIESTEVKCQELQNKVDTLSEEIQKKTESAEELQRMSGEDLVQELAKLRRSLIDAEGVSRDTKKEWAVLRSQNIALEELKVNLTSNLEKMEAEVNSLHAHLEIEKSRYRKMESDLQKELTVTFDENNKLTDLLDGKVPKDLIDRMEFERKVATLSEELTASCKAEGSLRAQLEELASCQTQNQVSELSEELSAIRSQRESQTMILMQKQQTKVLQYDRAEKEALLSEQKAKAQSSAEEMDQLLSTLTSMTAERDQLKVDLQENVEMIIENQEELRTALEKNREQQELLSHLETLQTTKEDGALSEMSAQLEARQKRIKTLTEQVENAGAEREALLFERMARFPSSSDIILHSSFSFSSVCEERDQLQKTLQELRQEKMQMRAELGDKVEGCSLEESDQQRALLVERLNEMQQLMKHYEKKLANSEVSRTSKEGIGTELQEQQKQQTKVLQYVQSEKEALLSEQKAEAQSSAEEMDQLLSTLTSMTAERDQLKVDLQDNVEMMIENQEELRTALEKNREQKELLIHLETLQTSKEDGALSEMSAQLEARQKHIKTLMEQVGNAEKERKAIYRVMSVSEESDQLKETLQEVRQEKQKLRAELGDKMDALPCEMKTLTEKLESTETERDSLLCEKEASFQSSSSEEKERLLCRVMTLCEERDQLQELRQEKQQLRAELEDKIDTLQCEMKTLTEKLESTEREQDSLLCEKEAIFQSSSEEKKKLICRVTSLCEERDQLQETLQELRQENQQLKAEVEDKMETLQCEVKTLKEKMKSTEKERDGFLCEKGASFKISSEEKEKLLCRVTSLCEERDQLQETLQELRQENQQLRAELEDKMKTLQCEVKTLTEKLESPERDQDTLLCEKEAIFQSSSEEKEKLFCRVTSLCEERDQLQETLQELRQEKQQLKAEVEDKMETLQCEVKTLKEKMKSTEKERDGLLCEKGASFKISSEEKEKLLCRVTSLCEERDQLQETLQELRQENQQLRAELEDKMKTLQCEVKTLTEKLESPERDQDSLLCEKEAIFQSSSEEKEKLFCRVTSLCEERDQLQETLQELRQEKQQLKAEVEDKMETLQCEVKTLKEKMKSTEKERDGFLCEKGASFKISSEEKEKLLCRVTSLCEERDQLQETLQELRQENQQLRAELEDKMKTLQCEVKTLTEKLESPERDQDSLLCEKEAIFQSSSEEKEKLFGRVTSLCEERDQLHETLQELRQEKQQLKAEVEDKMETLQCEVKTLKEKMKSTEKERDGLLCEEGASFKISSEEKEKLLIRVTSLCEERDQLQETLQELRQENQQLRAELEDNINTLQCEVKTLKEKMKSTQTERDNLLCEQEASFQSSSEEKVLCRVTSLCDERDQLQETLQELRQENQQLRAVLEDQMTTMQCEVKTLTEKAKSTDEERDSLLFEKEASFQISSEEKEKLLCRVTSLCEERDQLQETLQELRQENQQLRAELEDKMKTLQCELLSEDRGSAGVELTVSSRLNDSTRQLQETFRGFQHSIDRCSKYISTPMDTVLRVQSALNHDYLTSLPKATMSAYTAICQLGLETVQTLGNIIVCLQVKAQDCRNRFEELVKKDLSVFEERRLQDVLMCRVQAPTLSVKDEDLHTVWEHRLADLLDKRQLYQQKMSIILKKFSDNVACHPNELSAEITERKRFKEQLQGAISTQPISFSELDSILSCELDRRAALAHSKKMILQGITAEQSVLSEELKLLEAQARFQLREEKSKSSTLLQAIEGAPLKSELSLLKDNQNLLTQLMQTEEEVKALHVQNEQLEKAQIKATNGLSSHKQATQLLQTELQDSSAQNDEKEKTILTLRGKLQESEKRASPSVAELESLQTKLFKMEVELSSASDKHKQEIQRMTTVLNVKEESLRNLKETLRRLQQQGEESFLQGEDLHTKLTNPRGVVIKSSILLDKTILEKEVKQLCLKITELECLVSTQQTEISKWKSRAINLKAKGKVEVDKPSSPCKTTKRGLQETSDSSSFLSSPKKLLVTSRKILDSPRKVMDFPKVYQLDSPKSSFFDVGGSSDLLPRTFPKQFFDNSCLGTIPDADAATGLDVARKDEWWPKSPKQEDMCKAQ